MTTITLEVLDDLAARLATRREQLPQLLSMALELFPDERLWEIQAGELVHPAYQEMIDFLVSRPTPARIVALYSLIFQSPNKAKLGQFSCNSLTNGLN